MGHTSGPWRTELYQWDEAPCGVGQRLAVIRQPRGDVDIAYVPVDEDDGEMQDNESLIAAAPDLYAVCKLLFQCMGEVIEDQNEVAYSDLRMALMKAERET
jgi:hypothetical protein